MSSAFDTAFNAAGVPALLGQFGRQVSYAPAAGDAVDVTAMVGSEESREALDSDGRRVVRVRELTVSTDPAGDYGGVAAVKLNDTVTIDGAAYAVSQVFACSSGLITVEVTRAEDIERSRPGYRRGR